MDQVVYSIIKSFPALSALWNFNRNIKFNLIKFYWKKKNSGTSSITWAIDTIDSSLLRSAQCATSRC